MSAFPKQNRLKKWVSSFLIFTIFASQTIQIPLSVPKAFATGSDAPNLVSIIITESTYAGEVKAKVDQYSADIQAAMTNTRVIIVNVPDNIAPHSIAALNEKLYYEGDGNGISRLVGTVLIGKIPLPVVHNGSKSFLSIYPYTDFDEKVFLFDTEKGYYEASSGPVAHDSPEIWHGVIQPNTGNSGTDRQKLVEYLDKTHNFYTKQGVFANMSQTPYVFYLDITHDQKAASVSNWKSYNLGLEYLEDLSYNRFNKHLAKTLYEKFQGFQNAMENVDPAETTITVPTMETMDFSTSPDIQTRAAITKVTKQFFEIFNEKYLGDILKFVYNTGRYGDGTNTRADVVPVLVSKRDEFMKRVIKDSNTALENSIDQLVKNGLSRDIAIPTTIKVNKMDSSSNSINAVPPVYQNYYFGKQASTITNAKECSITRGSTLPVEANRGYNILNVQGDVQKLSQYSTLCFAGSTPATMDFWGGNSPLNLKMTPPNSTFQLQGNQYKNYVLPTYDLFGQKEFTPGGTLQINSPADCSASNFIADPYVATLEEEFRSSYFYHPQPLNGTQFVCVMRDSNGAVGHKFYTNTYSFADAIANRITPPACTVVTVNLAGGFTKQFGRLCDEDRSTTVGVGVDAVTTTNTVTIGMTEEYNYKKISSWIQHKSPTDEEYGAALKGMTTPSLASDGDRYIDFIGPSGAVQKIVYPNFFRLNSKFYETGTGNLSNLTLDMVKDSIKTLLDQKSAEINGIINGQNPASLSGDQKAMAQLLSSGAYPTANVDLYGLVSSSGNMLTTLADTILWYNKSNATSKYAFALENYLDRDGNRDYPLSGHRSDYEMAYIGGPGDAQNMYVKLDPEAKGNLPKNLSDIQGEYGSLMNQLNAANMSAHRPEDSKFKCGPPEGVPIWQWLPAVFCWLGTILPPTISAGSCGPKLGGDKENDKKFFTAIIGADGKPEWQMDRNHNGILDGYEWIKDGELKLATPLKRIGYRTSAILTADLTKDSRILAHDSYNEVRFDISKIILKKDQIQLDGTPATSDKVVYMRGGSGDSGTLETLKKYVFFTPINVRADAGTAVYQIQSIDRDIDISIDATVAPKNKNGVVAFTKVSNTLMLQVRDEALKISTETQSGTGTQVSTTFRAGEADKISFTLGVSGKNPETPVAAKSPVKVKILDDIDGSVLQTPPDIAGNVFSYNGNLLKQAGDYRFEFVDAEDRFGTVMVNVLPGEPVKIEAVASSSMFVKWQKNMILVSVKDAFDNYAKGDLLQIKWKMSGGGFFSENNAVEMAKSTVEGVMNFEMSANDGGQTHTLNFSTTDSNGTVVNMASPLTVKSIDYAKIRVNVPNRTALIAGGSGQLVNLEIADSAGQILTGFNGVASIDFPKNSGSFDTQFVQILNGKNKDPITFKPGTVAVIDAKIDIQVPGIKDIEWGTLSILPNVPMRVGLLSDIAKLEAKPGNSAGITAELFDRYGNLAYNHTPGLQANFTIPSGYGKYGTVGTASVAFANGVAHTQINASSNPGTLYYTVEVTAGLESNSFTIVEVGQPNVVIKGYSKNVAYIESFYLWNAEKLQKTNYNVLSTTLLGADYGNITIPNYLAGELIFNTDSSSMAVTTLLNNAEKKAEIVQMTPGGKLILNQSKTAEIQFGSNKNQTTLDIFDPFKRENIGRFYLNIAPNTPIFNCESDDIDELGACDIGGKDSYIVLKWLGSAKATRSTAGLTLSFDGVPVFEITPSGAVKKYPTVIIEADGTENKNLLSLSILSGGTKIGRLGIKWNASQILVSSPDTVDSMLTSNPGTIVYEGISPRYAMEQDLIGNSSYGAKWLKIFAQNEESQVDADLVGSSEKQGYEDYNKKEGIGFGDGNNTQLEFASQASVGEAAKSYVTYSEIVIGDPVARLPEILSPQNYDRTLGKKLISSAGGIIESYATIDYNKDGMEDIVVFYQDGKVELLQNYKWVYKSLGYLLYVVDAGAERKAAGDFNGDGYGDLVMVDKDGKLIVIENHQGKFIRVPTKIVTEAGVATNINGAIMQLELFDMDKDGKMDLVISDDSGELNILYGGGSASGIVFTKKTLDDGIGIKIGTGSTTTGWAIRFDGIKEIVPYTQTGYVQESNASTADTDGEALSLPDQIRLLDSKIYYQQTVRKEVATKGIAQSTRLLGGVGDDPENPGVPNQALADSISAAMQDTQNLAADGSMDIDALTNTSIEVQKSYLRSEFADGKNIEITRKYIDVNGGFLQAGDPINVLVEIKNTSSTPLTGASYLDKYEKNVFQEGKNDSYTIYGSSGSTAGSGSLNKLTEGEFDYQFDQLRIPANEKIIIKYGLTANAISVGKFHVGILDPDDTYGDVSMNANAICGEQEILWKTIVPTPRTYTRTLKDIVKSGDVAGSQKGKFTDFNGNGSPDYIDLLSGIGDDNYIESSLWDPSKNGILMFREVPGPNGLDGTSFEIGRIVANPTTGFVQLNPVSQKEDVPVLSTPSLSKSTLNGWTISSGSVGNSSMPSCGQSGTVTVDLTLVGFEQTFNPSALNDVTANLKVLAIGKSNTVNASGSILSSEDCQVTINSPSNPAWNGTAVTGIGWKILTKSTFQHFSMAGTQSDIINPSSGIPDSHEPRGDSLIRFNDNGTLVGGTIDIGGMSSENVDKVNGAIDTIVQGLGCGFGWGSCLSMPMNQAPLAPGSAPVIMGYPIGGLGPSTGYPVFSALTGNQTMCGNSPCCLPTIYPMSKRALIPGPACGANSAGGSYGTWAPTNTFRFYITPTITGAVGIAACFGGTSAVTGRIPPQAVSPLVPGGNCVVAAKPLLGCKDDGSDGSFQDMGSSDNGTLNAGSCKNATSSDTISPSDQAKIRSYVQGNTSVIKDIIANANGRGSMRMPSGPLLTMGGWHGGAGNTSFELAIDVSNIKSFDIGMIEKIKNERVSAFPDFIMDWVNRQLEEVANKLTSLPTLYIIKPDFRGTIDTQWSGFTDKLEGAYASGQQKGSAVLGNENAGRNISGVKAAYEFMSRLPLIKFEKTTLDITYPDIGREELEKALSNLKATKSQWEKEINSKKALYQSTATASGMDSSILVRADGLVGSINQNVRTIEDYKKYPEKLAKYLTWKERYAAQLLCNITAIQNMLDGFITKNAIRFKAWVEFFELLKNILKGWQLIPDLFYAHEAECGVCRNERYDAKHFTFKLIKSIIPPFPIIKFPKWPDIILDLHNVRLGIRIAMPEFVFHPTPIVLPKFPNLALPGTPSLGISLPSIPTLPSLPPLPDMPDLPTLPVITLPELPPPPTIPKLFGAIKFTLNILKIIAKVLCIMRTNPFVPEWRAGDQIAQITERQGKMKLDFLNIEFPQFNASFVDAIKVTTFVNFEFQVDFLLEMAKTTFEPINAFSSNLSNIVPNATRNLLPKKVDLGGLNPGHKEINVGPTGMDTETPMVKEYAQTLARAFVTTIKQGQFYANESAAFEDIRENLADELAHTHATPGTPGFALLEEMKEGLSYRGDAESKGLAQKLQTENTEKFNLANGFVKSEIREVAELKAKLQLVQTGKKDFSEIFNTPTLSGNSKLISSTDPYSTESELPDFTRFNENAYSAYSDVMAPKVTTEMDILGQKLKDSMKTYSAEAEKKSIVFSAGTATTSNGQLADYEYRGIYTMDNGKQIRLFDYTNELMGNERAIKVNRFWNGAVEYIYQSGNGLYLKTKLGNSVPKPVTDTIVVYTPSEIIGVPDSETILPTAPNHFIEGFAASGEINFWFKPADPKNDTIFRLEFYDYIDRFDRLMGGQHWSAITPTTRVSYVDLVPEFTNETVTDASVTGLVMQKPYASYQSWLGNGFITGPGYRTLHANETIQVASNKSIYSDGGGTRIMYQVANASGTGSTSYTIDIPSSGELKFLTNMDIRVISGNVILIDDLASFTPRAIDLRELSGMPVIVGQKVEVPLSSARLDVHYYNDATLEMNGPSFYESYDLGSKSNEYQVALRQENSWYYAKLQSVSAGPKTSSRITLLSPQSQADKEPPLIQIGNGFRAPVYLEQGMDLREQVTDVSGIKDVYFDTDLMVDTNGDGKMDNDRDSDSGSGVLRKGASNLQWYIKPQDRLYEKKIKVWAEDENGNISGQETKLKIYAPIPDISTQSWSAVTGTLDESLEGEPVDIVRFRNGKIVPIGNAAQTGTGGAFQNAFGTDSGVVVQWPTGEKLVEINEKTGKLTLSGSENIIVVLPADADAPMRIQIRKRSDQSVLYTQSVALGSAGKIEPVANLNEAITKAKWGIGIRLDTGWNFVRNAGTSPTLPGWIFVTDTDMKAVFGIAKDGNVYFMKPGLKLEYRTERDYFVIEVRTTAGNLIGTLYYILDAEYVIK